MLIFSILLTLELYGLQMKTTDELFNEIKNAPYHANILFHYIQDSTILSCVKYETEPDRFVIYVGKKGIHNIARKLMNNIFNKKLPVIIINENEPTKIYCIDEVCNDIKLWNEINIYYIEKEIV